MTLIMLIGAIGLSLSLLPADFVGVPSIIALASVKYAAKTPTGKSKEQF